MALGSRRDAAVRMPETDPPAAEGLLQELLFWPRLTFVSCGEGLPCSMDVPWRSVDRCNARHSRFRNPIGRSDFAAVYAVFNSMKLAMDEVYERNIHF